MRLASLATLIVDRLSPPWCLHCRAGLADGHTPLLVCRRCRGLFRPVDTRSRCRCCLRELTAGRDAGPRCLACRSAPPVDRLVAAWWYEPPLSDVLRRLKFGRLEALARPLVEAATARELTFVLEATERVVPVPLALWRRWNRGFNQAESLAGPLAERLGIPLTTALTRRTPVSRRQARLGRRLRQRIRQGGYLVREQYRGEIAGRSVLLVDDIVTTGATLAAAASALRAAGAREVLAFVIAATPRRGPRPAPGDTSGPA